MVEASALSQGIITSKGYVPAHGTDAAAILLRNKPINNDEKGDQFPIQILGFDERVVFREFRPLIARCPGEGWSIQVKFVVWVVEVGWGGDIEDTGHLGIAMLVRKGCVKGSGRTRSTKWEEVGVGVVPVSNAGSTVGMGR